MIVLKSIIKKVKQLFSINAKNNRSEMMIYRLSTMNDNRKSVKA
jgi:hypothetical protein